MNTQAVGSQSLKVLHVISSMAAEAGGPPAVCAGLTAALAARKHEVVIATLMETGQLCVPTSKNVDIVAFPKDSGAGAYGTSQALNDWLLQQVGHFDLVHLHSLWQFPTFAAARACWGATKHKPGVPYVLLLNGMLDTYSVKQRSYWKKWIYWAIREGRIARHAHGIHCLNQAEVRCAVPWITHLPKFIVGNGISSAELERLPDRGHFRAAHPEIADRPLALFLSRLHPKKGLDRLIPAWKTFIALVPEGRLAIAGSGDPEYVAALDRLIESHGLVGKVLRVGQLVGTAKWEALVDSDVFVLPSHQEGFSMAITEALAAGCVPVVTEECNFDELSQQSCGIIISNGDMQKFIASTAELLGDTARRRAMAEKGRNLVRERYTWEKIAQEMEQVYRWIIAGKDLQASGTDLWRA